MHDDRNRYGVCSRKEDLVHRHDNLYWQAAMGSCILAKLRHFPTPNIALQGELCGSSIEDNTMNYPEGKHDFVVFAIWDIDKARYIRPREVEEVCGQFGIRHVPVVAYCSLDEFARDLDELLRKAEGKGKFGGVREGFVFKSVDGDAAFKVISNSWLSLVDK
jgi:ATP-dependent RNA circularization protein (DNA/RNA ligase family)